MGDDVGMTDGIAALFVDVRVQALEIVIEDAFVTFHVSVELIGIGSVSYTHLTLPTKA